MKYVDDYGNQNQLIPTDDWRYAAGYWIDSSGDFFNISEKVAEQGGAFVLDEPKEKKVVLLALNYAKQRRERSILALQREIANLDKAIIQL